MIKETIKKIPIVGDMLVRLRRKVAPVEDFENSEGYWKERYRDGGNSGAGSYDHLAEFKAETINKFVNENSIESIIEFGCGDGNQLGLFEFERYTGFDISRDALELCRGKFYDDETKEFLLTDEFDGHKADMTMSLDVIYHLIEDAVYHSYMENLFDSAEKFVVVYASNKDEILEDTKHVRHRKFTDWVTEHRPEFENIAMIPNKYPYDGDWKKTSFADFYFFERSTSSEA